MDNRIDEQEILKSPFNVYVHKANFKSYCEVIIWPDGKIEYAVPSHEQKLLQCYAIQEGKSLEEIMQECQHDRNLYDRLMKKTGICQIWYDHIYNEVPLTTKQLESISLLITHGCISDRALDTVRYF